VQANVNLSKTEYIVRLGYPVFVTTIVSEVYRLAYLLRPTKQTTLQVVIRSRYALLLLSW